MREKWLTTIKITFIATYIAITYALQVALASLPNVETVTLFLIIAGVQLPLGISLLVGISFTSLEIITYGIGDWALLYLIAWSIIITLSLLLRKIIQKWWWVAVILGSLFGFCFGSIDALIKGLLYGPSGLYAYWITGLLFDLIHGVSNFLVILFCYLPISKVVKMYTDKFCYRVVNEQEKYAWIPLNLKVWYKLL